MKNICIIPPGAKNTINDVEKQDLSAEQHSYLYRPQTNKIPDEIREQCFKFMTEYTRRTRARRAVNTSILSLLGTILLLLSIGSLAIILHVLAIMHKG